MHKKIINLSKIKNLKIKMGCIGSSKLKDRKYTYIIVSNNLNNKTNDISKYSSQCRNEIIYSKRISEDYPLTNISQNDEDLIENPLPFVRTKRKKNNINF